MSLNHIALIGNCGKDAELRYTPGGAAVAKFSLAVNEKWTDKSGDKQEKVEWFDCTLWGKQAETLAEYLKKGKQVYVDGRMRSNEWEKDGVKRRSWEVNVRTVVLLGGRRDDDGQPEPAMAGADSDAPF